MSGRVTNLRERIRAEVRTKRGLPSIATDRVVQAHDQSAIVLGRDDRNAPLVLPLRPRLEHSWVVGTTGAGKSKFLEHCIRQDITLGHGVCVVDPHGNHPGSLYRALLSWIETQGRRIRRPIHLIDPNAATHTIGFNPLARPSTSTDLSVIAGTVLEAVSRVWGDEDTDAKPTMTRALEGTFMALAELGLTLAEERYLFKRNDEHGIRAYLLSKVTDRSARDFLERLNELSEDARSFDAETIAPLNRLSKFVRSKAILSIIGQTDDTIDFARAFDEGHIILVNLSGGDAVHESDADLLGRLLVRFLFFHAKRRAQNQPPFFLYLDECQRYLSGDIPNLLAEARKYGVGAVLSHQYLRQLGEPNDPIRAAVLNATNVKCVFRLQSQAEAQELAEAVMRLDYETPLAASIRPTVVGHRVRMLASESSGKSRSTSESVGSGTVETLGKGATVAEMTAASEAAASTFASMSATSFGSGTMTATATGSSAGQSTGQVMNPEQEGVFFTLDPIILSTSSGESAAMQQLVSSGSSTSQARSNGNSEAKSTMQSQTRARSMARSSIEARSVSSSCAKGTASGSSETQGTSEAFEPVYADLPSQFHSKENVLSMAGDILRSLAAGRGFVGYVDQSGRHGSFLSVPFVQALELSQGEFETLRKELLGRSPSARPAKAALFAIEERERLLSALAAKHRTPEEPADASGFKEPIRRKVRKLKA